MMTVVPKPAGEPASAPRWPRARLAELDARASELTAAGDWLALLACREEAAELAEATFGDNGTGLCRGCSAAPFRTPVLSCFAAPEGDPTA